MVEAYIATLSLERAETQHSNVVAPIDEWAVSPC